MNTHPACLLLLCAALAGCSSIPSGGDPAQDGGLRALAKRDRPTLGRLGVAPIETIRLSKDENAKGWKVEAAPQIKPNKIQSALAAALAASGTWESVRLMDSANLSEAWKQRDQVVASLAIEELRLSYDGRNAWWIPNLVNWFIWMAPAWWVATEDYSLSLEGVLTLTSAESGTVLASERLEVQVAGAFDEFDRGWHYFGFIYTPLDAERWLRIAGKLFPAAQLQLAVKAGKRADTLMRRLSDSEAFEAQTRKTLVLSLGLSRYTDTVQLPRLPYATQDALAIGEALVKRGVVAPEHVRALIDADLTETGLRSAVREHLGRARPGDSVLVYLAGYGTRSATGAELLLHDGDGRAAISLQELRELLADVQGETLLVVDAAFDGGQRSVTGVAHSGAADLTQDGVATILAGAVGQPAVAQEHIGHGLLTYHLLRGMTGTADSDRNGLLTARELFEFAQPAVIAEAALVGATQAPRSTGLKTRFVLPLQKVSAKN